jgi:hypothetical protein
VLEAGSHVADGVSQAEVVFESHWLAAPGANDAAFCRFSGFHACKSSMAASHDVIGVRLILEIMYAEL